jgi:predicted Zn-dependent peptidase
MPPTFHQQTLANGLTIVAETDAEAHTAAVGFFVRAGARDEDRPLMGVSHFLEHMMFKGTARRTADDVNREFDELGANYNAYTSHETTVYYAHVLPEFLPRSVDLLGDMLRPALRDEDFNVEKNVILEEIGMYDDRPQSRLMDMLLEAHFGEHPLGFRVLGTTDSIKALGVEQMRGYFRQRYSPDNIVVSAAGRVDFAALVSDVAKIAGQWEPSGIKREHGQPAIAGAQLAHRDERLSRHYLAMFFPGPAAQDERRYAARVMADALGDSEGSRLYWALVDPGLADEADFSHYPQDHVGGFIGYASCDPQRAGQVEGIYLDALAKFARSVEPGEIERAKNKLATHATLQGERPAGRMRSIGNQWTYLRQYLTLDQELAGLMAVGVDDVRQLAGELVSSPRTLVRLGP